MKKQKMMQFAKRGLLFAICLLCTAALSAQSTKISGTVVDELSEPAAGVNVSEKGTTNGTITDVNGQFTLDVSGENSLLVISSIGYVKQEIRVGNQRVFNIELKEDLQLLDEVVVVGYGVQKKANLTGAVGNIDSKELVRRVSPNTATLLQGRVPGLSVVQNSGMPGAESASIQIRGQGTFSSAGSNPLILIDGIEGDLTKINPNVIENISVLKDASSAAIYGSRAANGVILVTTKSGHEGRLSVDYSYNIGFQNPTTLQKRVLNSVEYMEMWNAALAHVGSSSSATPYTDEQLAEWRAGQDPNSSTYDPNKYPNCDWLDYLLRDNATIQQHFLSVNGGKNGTTYNFGGGFLDQTGMLIATDYKRYDLQMNMKTNLGGRVTFGSSVSFSYGKRHDTAQGGTPFETNQTEDQMLSAYARSPLQTPYLPDGSGRYTGRVYANKGGNKNPIAIAENGGQVWDEYYTLANAFVQVDILPGLTGEVKGAVRFKQQDGKALTVSVVGYDFHPDSNGEYVQSAIYNGNVNSLSVRNNQEVQYTLYSTFNYNKTFADAHNLSAMAGYSQEDFTYKRTNAYRTNVPGIMWELDAAPQANQTSSGYSYKWALQSVFGRLNYDYLGRYLFEANFRYDGTSRFPKGNRWGLFPSFSGGWRFSEEEFAKIPWLQNGKLRASWGQLGNQNINNSDNMPYPYQDILTSTVYNINGGVVQGWTLNDMVNTDLEWETTTAVNIGLDFGVFGGKFYGSVDWYNRKTTNILRSLQVPTHAGLNSPQVNDGEMQNRGWEFLLGHNNRIGEFSYGVSATLDANRNKVLKYGSREIGTYTITEEGLPYGSYYLYVFDGIYQNEAEIAAQTPLSSLTKPGDMRYVAYTDPTGSTSDDRRVISGIFPKFNYGFSLNAAWQGFDLSAFFQGVEGKKVYVREWGIAPFRQGSAPATYWRNAWNGEGTSNTIPHIFYDNYAPNTYASTWYLQDASYLRLKNLQVGYTLPSKIAQAAYFQALRVYFSGDNLLTFTSMFQGIDPERTASSSRAVIYPQAKIYSFGIKVTL